MGQGFGALLARAILLSLGLHGDLPKIPFEGKLLLLKEDLENYDQLTEENTEHLVRTRAALLLGNHCGIGS